MKQFSVDDQFRSKTPDFNISLQRDFIMKVALLAILIHLDAFLSEYNNTNNSVAIYY